MTAMGPAEVEFVDRMGLFFENVGGPRTMGRIYGWLMICDPPHQSLTELAAALDVSKASISTAVRPMLEGDLVQRTPTGGRQHHYRLTPGGFTHVLHVQLSRLGLGADAAEFGLSVLDSRWPDRVQQREQLTEFRDFCEFAAGEVQRDFMARWEAYRAERSEERKRAE